jgi:hypothetical protein
MCEVDEEEEEEVVIFRHEETRNSLTDVMNVVMKTTAGVATCMSDP